MTINVIDGSCCCQPCPACQGAIPEQIQVTFTGITNTFACSGGAGDCTDFNDTFILDWEYDPVAHGWCNWIYRFPSGTSPCNTQDYIRVSRSKYGSPEHYSIGCDIGFEDTPVDGYDAAWRILDLGTEIPTCTPPATGIVIPYYPVPYICTNTSSTCVVSSI